MKRTSSLTRTIAPAALLVVIIGAAVVLSQRAALAAPEQPFPFSHQTHAEASIGCLYCHSGALRGDSAGIPSIQKCMGCHSTIATDRPPIQTLAGYWERQEAVPWVRVNQAEDFVYFSHQPHLAASVSCETCHGDVARMTVARPVDDMDMGWCLDCHLEQPEEKVVRLADCLTCHK